MRHIKKYTPWLLLIFLILPVLNCRDVVFNNPLDPQASKDVVRIIRIIDTTLSGPGDMTFDGEKIWKFNPYGTLAAVDRESGTLIRSFSTESGTGVTFFRDIIYLCNGQGENMLYELDPLSGDVFNRLTMSSIFPGYLAAAVLDGADWLIIYDTRSSGIFRYDPESGDIARLFEVAGLDIGGMETYKDGLLITDSNTDSLYFFDWNGAVKAVYSAPEQGIGGITVDDGNDVYLFMSNGKIYKVTLP